MSTDQRMPYTDPTAAYPPPVYPPMPQQFKVPGIGPVIAFTAIFGVFGAISAARRSKKAKAVGMSGSKYWTAFGVTFVAVWAVSGIIAAVAGMSGGTAATPQAAAPAVAVPATDVVAAEEPAGIELAEDAFTAAWLQQDIVDNSDFKTPEGEHAEVAAATCSAASVDEQGVGSYQCVIDFASGQRQSQNIIVDASGAWVTNA